MSYVILLLFFGGIACILEGRTKDEDDFVQIGILCLIIATAALIYFMINI